MDWTKELAATLEQQGATFVDAPVVGSRPQAEAGKLIYLIGSETEVLETVQPILSATSGAIHHVGAIGQGTAMKLAVNALFGIQVAALAELLGMLAKYGITPEKAMTCLGELPVTSLAAKGAGSLMVMHQHAPLFPIDLVEKDFRYVVQTAQAAGAEIPTAIATQQVYQDAIVQGKGQNNITGIAQMFMD